MKRTIYTLLFTFVNFNLFSQEINLQNHFGEITNAIFNEKFILTSGEDRTVKLWEKGENVKTFYFESDITTFKPHPYEPDIILIHLSEKVCFYNLKNETIERVIRLKSKGLANTPTSTFTNDKKYIIANFDDNNSLSVVGIQSGKLKINLEGLHSGFVIDYVLSADDKLLISGDETGKIVIWDMINYIPKKIFLLNQDDELLKIVIDENTQRIVFFCNENKVSAVDLKKLTPIDKKDINDKLVSPFFVKNHYLYTKINDFWVVTKDKSKDENSYAVMVFGDKNENREIEKKESESPILSTHFFDFVQPLFLETAEMLQLNELINAHKNLENFSRIKLELQKFILFEKTLIDELPNQNSLLKVWDIKKQKMIFEHKNRGWIFDMALNEDSLLAIVGSNAQLFDLKNDNKLIFKNLENVFGWMYNGTFYENNLVVNGQFPNLLFYDFSQAKVQKVSNVTNSDSNYKPYVSTSKDKLTAISEASINTWNLSTKSLEYSYKLKEKMNVYSVLAEDELIFLGLDKSEIGVINTAHSNQLIKIKLDDGYSTINKMLITPDKKWIIAINDDDFAFVINKEKLVLKSKKYLESDIFTKNNNRNLTPDKKWEIRSFYDNYWISNAK